MRNNFIHHFMINAETSIDETDRPTVIQQYNKDIKQAVKTAIN